MTTSAVSGAGDVPSTRDIPSPSRPIGRSRLTCCCSAPTWDERQV
ncbi:MAG: hypothetical protein QM736_04690 [Vicinamibacterales bacterium]